MPHFFLRGTRPFVWLLALLAANAFGQQSASDIADYTALGVPSYAQTLGLSDQQVAEVARILDERRNAIVTADPDDRSGIIAAANRQLESLLTQPQKQNFAELVAGGKLRFSFRNEPWDDVLHWFAVQADLALVMDDPPPGQFTYNDNKNHTPTQAIDLLNSVLQSRGFTLVRREKMLIVSSTADGLPYDMVPEVTPEQLPDRGRFEYVSVLFPLEGRPVDSVATEIAAFLGTNGRATPLPATGQLMVVDTAGRVDAIGKLIASIPKPKKKEQKPKQAAKPKPKPPAPVFQVHSASGLDVDVAMEALKQLYGDAKFTGDRKAEQITAFTPPSRQEAIKKTLAQMVANVTGENTPTSEIYTVVEDDLEQLQNVVAQATPGIQISGDAAGKRLLVVGDARQQDGVRQTLEKLNAVDAAGDSNSVGIYDVDPDLADQLVGLVQPLVPRANVVVSGGRIAVRGSSRDQLIAKSAIEQLQDAEEAIEKPTLHFFRLNKRLEGRYLESVRQLVPRARISEVANGAKLAIVATEEDYQRAVQAVQRVEAELQETVKTQMQQFPVTVEDSNRLLSMLKGDFPGTRMMLNDRRDAVLAWLTEEQVPLVEEKINEITAVLPAKRDELWRYYPVADMSMSDIESLIRPIVRRAQFKPQADRKRVMILATVEEHELISKTLGALQSKDPSSYQDVSAAYAVNRGDAATIVEMVRGLVPDAKIASDDRANKILVTAPLREQERVRAIIEQLDVGPGESTEEIARTYSVGSLAA